jgi:2,4-dienoyl-CoA reductase (NADPH2)
VPSEIDQGGFGIVLACRRSTTHRRTRLIAQVRKSVVGLIGTDPQVTNMLIPVDLSDATLLALAFVQRFYGQGPSEMLHFIHIRTDTAQTAGHRWQYFKKVGDFPSHWKLRMLTERDDIANAIAEAADAHRCNAIIMGKRGLAGIKRWLIGSVSVGVLKRLRGKSLILVD